MTSFEPVAPPADAGRTSSLQVSVCLLDADTGEALNLVAPDTIRPTASVGKVLLLTAVAGRLVHHELDPAALLTRTPEDAVEDSGLHPPTLSTGTARELAHLFAALHRGRVIDPTVSAEVLGWLNLDTDMSMTAGAFGLDPLAHTIPDRGRWLAHKTGSDIGLRADVGVLRGPLRAVAYAVIAEFDDADREDALAVMREWGWRIGQLAG